MVMYSMRAEVEPGHDLLLRRTLQQQLKRLLQVRRELRRGVVNGLSPEPAQFLMEECDQSPLQLIERALAPGAGQDDQMDTAAARQIPVGANEVLTAKRAPRIEIGSVTPRPVLGHLLTCSRERGVRRVGESFVA